MRVARSAAARVFVTLYFFHHSSPRANRMTVRGTHREGFPKPDLAFSAAAFYDGRDPAQRHRRGADGTNLIHGGSSSHFPGNPPISIGVIPERRIVFPPPAPARCKNLFDN